MELINDPHELDNISDETQDVIDANNMELINVPDELDNIIDDTREVIDASNLELITDSEESGSFEFSLEGTYDIPEFDPTHFDDDIPEFDPTHFDIDIPDIDQTYLDDSIPDINQTYLDGEIIEEDKNIFTDLLQSEDNIDDISNETSDEINNYCEPLPEPEEVNPDEISKETGDSG